MPGPPGWTASTASTHKRGGGATLASVRLSAGFPGLPWKGAAGRIAAVSSSPTFSEPGGVQGEFDLATVDPAAAPSTRLRVTVDFPRGGFAFEWTEPVAGAESRRVIGSGTAACHEQPGNFLSTFAWRLEDLRGEGRQESGQILARGSSANAFVARVCKWIEVETAAVEVQLRPPAELRDQAELSWASMPAAGVWVWLQKELLVALKVAEEVRRSGHAGRGGGAGWRAATGIRWVKLRIVPALCEYLPDEEEALMPRVRAVVDFEKLVVELAWYSFLVEGRLGSAHVRPAGVTDLEWRWEFVGATHQESTRRHRSAVHGALDRMAKASPVADREIVALRTLIQTGGQRFTTKLLPGRGAEFWLKLEEDLLAMAVEAERRQRERIVPVPPATPAAPQPEAAENKWEIARRRWEERRRRDEAEAKAQERTRQAEEAERRLAQVELERREREREARRQAAVAARAAQAAQAALKETRAKASEPPPEIPVQVEPLSVEVQMPLMPATNLAGWFLREHAVQWWVSNQTDDLLALPFCRIERLEYQIRTALRVVGPLRGRALLSDEVGLGKTIEAGLVLREYVTRGMVKRFLVVTLPSLVDQWAEELAEKFGLETQTTNAAARSEPETFWPGSPGIVASLHTLKQAGHLEHAQKVPWDMLIIDEAHHLRNRESQAWKAVNILPRQFLLLLTATPVQNSLEELYNLVTLLQPGQLPSPKEFQARFLDPKRPRQPREPEELRRLLQQVMIRNTRSSSGIRLPPRRAHTIFFEAPEAERRFWAEWEVELRAALAQLPPASASLWGRLLLQAAGSSPRAWREALDRFPDAQAAHRWRAAPVEAEGWRSKWSLIPNFARSEGGVVVFTQFLATQAALEEALRGAGVPVVLINGETPAAQRQPLTERFRQQGGVLLLTRSGTEGRNLQFSSQLVNFDLPWNPMEIEQRIGRLHRLGQTRPVQIHNFVARDTLQHHLLDLLQEKLNLFELVVGETGLILGDRFSSDEFAEEILTRWRDAEAASGVRDALEALGDELTAARTTYAETKELDQTLFAQDYESE